MSNTNFDPTGEKKARKSATFGGAIVCAFFNTSLGVLLAFCVLALTAPKEYKATPDAKTGKTPPPPTGLFYWAGQPGGDFEAKDAQFLSPQPGTLTVADSELNAWSVATFKLAAPKPKAPVAAATPAPAAASGTAATGPSTADKVKDDAKLAAADLQSFGLVPGNPNFHIFKDPQAPADAPVTFQISVPMTVTLLGTDIVTVYQARGVFVAGPSGPQFQPSYSYIGSARIPATGGLGTMLFDDIAGKFAASDAAKKYADAWAKLASATVQDGGLVLAGK